MLAQIQLQRCSSAINALIASGMNIKFIPLAISQIAHETAGFTSNVANTCNNLSGIKFINNQQKQKATKCTGSPEGNNYAKYANYNDWAADYIRILNIGVKPINSNSIQEFAEKLKQNAYYTDTTSNYIKGLNYWLKQFDQIIQEEIKKKNYPKPNIQFSRSF